MQGGIVIMGSKKNCVIVSVKLMSMCQKKIWLPLNNKFFKRLHVMQYCAVVDYGILRNVVDTHN